MGRSVYHSGTIGACLTARNGGINGVAVSQAVDEGGYMGQGIEEMIKNQKWDSAAEIAAIAVEEMSTNLPKEASVLNINVPNLGTIRDEGVEGNKGRNRPYSANDTSRYRAKDRSRRDFPPQTKVGRKNTAFINRERRRCSS